MKEKVHFIKELWPLCRFFFIAPSAYDEKTVKKRWKAQSPEQMTALADLLAGLSAFDMDTQEKAVSEWIAANGYKTGDIMNAWRLTLVGEGKGPHMYEISSFLGQEETIRRMRAAVEALA